MSNEIIPSLDPRFRLCSYRTCLEVANWKAQIV